MSSCETTITPTNKKFRHLEESAEDSLPSDNCKLCKPVSPAAAICMAASPIRPVIGQQIAADIAAYHQNIAQTPALQYQPIVLTSSDQSTTATTGAAAGGPIIAYPARVYSSPYQRQQQPIMEQARQTQSQPQDTTSTQDTPQQTVAVYSLTYITN